MRIERSCQHVAEKPFTQKPGRGSARGHAAEPYTEPHQEAGGEREALPPALPSLEVELLLVLGHARASGGSPCTMPRWLPLAANQPPSADKPPVSAQQDSGAIVGGDSELDASGDAAAGEVESSIGMR